MHILINEILSYCS